jgi:flagellar biosynthetic protein FliR
MTITADVQWLLSVLLASIRVGAVFLFSPIFAITGAPLHFRVLFVLGLSLLLVTGLHLTPANAPISLSQLIQYTSYELVIGLSLAFGVFAAFGSFLLGGRILDFQMGFGVANLIDPATNTQTAMMGVVLNMIAVMVFFMVNGHHLLLRGLAYSFEKVPIGQSLTNLNVDAIVSQFGYMFVYAVMAVAPALFAILLLDVGLAVMARTMPQVNIFFVSIPLKIFVGLTITALSMRYMWPLMEKVFGSIFQYWENMLV